MNCTFGSLSVLTAGLGRLHSTSAEMVDTAGVGRIRAVLNQPMLLPPGTKFHSKLCVRLGAAPAPQPPSRARVVRGGHSANSRRVLRKSIGTSEGSGSWDSMSWRNLSGRSSEVLSLRTSWIYKSQLKPCSSYRNYLGAPFLEM